MTRWLPGAGLCVALMGCGGKVCDGNQVARNADEISPLQRCSEVRGDLDIALVGDVELPQLVEVTGAVLLRDIGRIRAANLTKVGKALRITQSEDLAVIDLPRLVTVGAEVQLSEVGATDIVFDSLQTTSALVVQDSPTTRTLSMPAVTDARTVLLQDNTELRTVELPVAKIVTSLTVRDNAELSSFDVGVDAEGSVGVRDLLIESNDTLTSFRLGVLQDGISAHIADNASLTSFEVESNGGFDRMLVSDNAALDRITLTRTTHILDLQVVSNPSLTRLRADRLLALGDVTIANNAQLPDCEVDAFLEVDSGPRDVLVSDNKGDGCP